ncbi:hypothetical protein HK100_012792 [Physocladia obscura]|uniref:Uncharacterized protein n=1 Tax=Physocladia obscura TaxID=109957 RepID=A0AAD5T094_9FUNG|nr:hypothetical protein HK100_012792 [Physocladia obscura]
MSVPVSQQQQHQTVEPSNSGLHLQVIRKQSRYGAIETQSITGACSYPESKIRKLVVEETTMSTQSSEYRNDLSAILSPYLSRDSSRHLLLPPPADIENVRNSYDQQLNFTCEATTHSRKPVAMLEIGVGFATKTLFSIFTGVGETIVKLGLSLVEENPYSLHSGGRKNESLFLEGMWHHWEDIQDDQNMEFGQRTSVSSLKSDIKSENLKFDFFQQPAISDENPSVSSFVFEDLQNELYEDGSYLLEIRRASIFSETSRVYTIDLNSPPPERASSIDENSKIIVENLHSNSNLNLDNDGNNTIDTRDSLALDEDDFVIL